MSATDVVNVNLEVQVIAVFDVDRSKGFYEKLRWRLDDDVAPLDALRVVQFTPPGSGTSVSFGKGSERLRQVRPRAPSSSLTSRRPTTNSSTVTSK